MEPVWILIAFVVGLGMRLVGLPPLVGFLSAGFLLAGMGVEVTPTLMELADLGIYLLLFSIGLKLDLRGLARKEVWGVASAHMLATTIGIGLGVFALAYFGLGRFAGLELWTALLIAFALSFSSTVFAVKVLESNAEMDSRHGAEAIGVLIVQDLFAIVFLTASTGKLPSPWALLLLLLPLLRFPLRLLIERVGHGELLVLYGLLLVMGSVHLFEFLQMKPDLGALVAGLLMGSHPKAGELSKALLSLKDLFLVAFFLTIGLQGVPTLEQLSIAVGLVVLLPAKTTLFFWLMTKFRLRARTAALSALPLSNYSEFGLIVGMVGVTAGWIDASWLLTMAIAMSLSFAIAAPFNSRVHDLYAKYMQQLKRWESAKRLPDDEHIHMDAPVESVVIAMGRVGTAAYDTLRESYGARVVGLDRDPDIVQQQAAQGRQVICGDATDPDFYARFTATTSCKLVVIALQDTPEVIVITRLLRKTGFCGHIVAMARFRDQLQRLREAGVDSPHYLHEEMGIGLARSAVAELAADTSASP